MSAELGEGDELVDHGAGAEEVADGAGLVPGDADEPGDGRSDDAEDGVEGVREGDVAVPPQAKLEMPSMMALKRPTSATKLMSMMATLKASWPPSMVPRAMAAMRFSFFVLFVGGM
jgi:hypothetical protein